MPRAAGGPNEWLLAWPWRDVGMHSGYHEKRECHDVARRDGRPPDAVGRRNVSNPSGAEEHVMKTRISLSLLGVMAALAVSGYPAALAQSRGAVANATFTADVVDGAPVDFRQQFSNTAPAVYYYAELVDLAGRTLKVRWSLEGQAMQESSIEVKSARQPAWSMIRMQPQWTGNWLVEVIDSDGARLDERNFAFNPPL